MQHIDNLADEIINNLSKEMDKQIHVIFIDNKGKTYIVFFDVVKNAFLTTKVKIDLDIVASNYIKSENVVYRSIYDNTIETYYECEDNDFEKFHKLPIMIGPFYICYNIIYGKKHLFYKSKLGFEFLRRDYTENNINILEEIWLGK